MLLLSTLALDTCELENSSGYLVNKLIWEQELSNGIRSRLQEMPLFSGCRAASVFGVTSAKNKNYDGQDAGGYGYSGISQSLSAITVAMEEDSMLTKLFPIRITPIELTSVFQKFACTHCTFVPGFSGA